MAKKRIEPSPIQPKVFQSPDEIDRGSAKFERRIQELAALDILAAVRDDTGADDVKDRSGNHDLDGASLVRAVFSRSNPLLAFNELGSQTDLDDVWSALADPSVPRY